MINMKLDIQMFNDGTHTVNTTALSDLAQQVQDVAAAIAAVWGEIKQNTNEVDTQEGFNTDSSASYAESVAALEGEFNDLIDVVAGLASQLVTTVTTYEDIDMQVQTAITDWSSTFKSAVQKVIGGLNSTVPKGSYSVGSYLSDMSQSTRNIVGEVATMIQNTGNAYTSLTGQSVVGTVKTVFDWIKNDGASIASSFVKSIFG